MGCWHRLGRGLAVAVGGCGVCSLIPEEQRWVPPAEAAGLSPSLFGANFVLTLRQTPHERILPSRYPDHSWEGPQGEWWGQRGPLLPSHVAGWCWSTAPVPPGWGVGAGLGRDRHVKKSDRPAPPCCPGRWELPYRAPRSGNSPHPGQVRETPVGRTPEGRSCRQRVAARRGLEAATLPRRCGSPHPHICCPNQHQQKGSVPPRAPATR